MPRVLALALVAPLVLVGCDQTYDVCTLIGCTTALSVRLDAPGPIPDGGYTVTATTASESASCTVAVAAGGTEVDSQSCSAYAFEDDVIVLLPPLRGRVTVSVARPGVSGAVGGGTADVAYEPQYPNGRSCGAACSLARVTVSIDA